MTMAERDLTRPSSMKRILLLTQYYAPEAGAPSVRLRAVVRELMLLGFEVRVVTGMPNYPTGKLHAGYEGKVTMDDEVDGVPVRRVWLYPACGKGLVRRALNYLSFTVTSAVALFAEEPADLVFVEAQPFTLAFPALLNKRVRKIPYVYNTPDLQLEAAEASENATVRGARTLFRAAYIAEGLLMREALTVSTVSQAFVRHFHEERGLPRKKISFLPNGAHVDELRPTPPDHALAARLDVAGRKVFTYAGTYAGYHGLDVLLDAARFLLHRQDIVFLMVGDGPERANLMDRARREGLTNVVFRDSPFAERAALMSITDAALVVLRRQEVSKKMRAAKAIPALACGVPLVYVGWGETGEMVERERVGLTVESANPREIARAVERLADDRAMRDAMGRRGRALAERQFSWAALVQDWVRQLGLIMEGRNPEIPEMYAPHPPSAGASYAAAGAGSEAL
jgi:colanic acid biosynthesis glycosyl transferase WcaI